MAALPQRQPAPPKARRRSLAAVATVAVLALAVACTRPADQRETGAAAPAPAAATGGTPSPASPSGSGAGDFGSLKAVCGPGNAKGSTAMGVTDSEIRVGTISDVGFSGRPGLNQELFDASEVFTKWCNAAGGINGRKIVDDELDAKLTEYKQRITEACQQDFMLVGGGGVFDDAGQKERLSCLLPDIPGYQVSAEARGSDLSVSAIPAPLDQLPIGIFQYLGQKFPSSTKKVAFLTGNVPATVLVDKQALEGVKTLGWKSVYRAQYNALGESSWTPFAEALRSNGAKGLVYTGEPENMAKLLQAIDDIGYKLDWVVVGPNHLDQNFIKVGGSAVHDVYLLASVVPFFDAAKNPATQQYLDLFKQYKPNGKSQAVLGYNSFSGWLLFAEAVKACGSNVTRKCVYDKAKATTSWTGGGLHAATNPSTDGPTPCYLVVEGTPQGFSVPADFKPTDGLFSCSDKSVANLKGDFGKGTTLADVGKKLSDLK